MQNCPPAACRWSNPLRLTACVKRHTPIAGLEIFYYCKSAISVGVILPADALARHMELLLCFVTSDYFDAYIDAAAGAADKQGTGSGGRSRRRSLGSSMMLSPTSQGTSSLASQDSGAAGLMLKCAALKALAAACVPDSDAQDAPVETLRVVVRLSEFLEG